MLHTLRHWLGIDDLEQRITALEDGAPISYDMPAPVDLSLQTNVQPLIDPPAPPIGPWPDDDEYWPETPTGVYL